jgi:cytochrome c5
MRHHCGWQSALVAATVAFGTVVVQTLGAPVHQAEVVQALGPAMSHVVVGQAFRPAVVGASFQQPPGRQSVWDGVYTDDQARRGEAHYARSCESCHGADLSGNPVDEIPALAWDAFLLHWNDKTIKDLFDSIKRAMPQDKPGSLNARAYVDVIAYLLQVNKFPSGPKEIGLNPDVLANIVIERTKK